MPEDKSSDQLNLVKGCLSEFFEFNPPCSLRPASGDGFAIVNPWADPSIEFQLNENNVALIDCLNSLVLPPRFSALWHRDTRDFEVIWAPIPADSEFRDRRFEFAYKNKTYICEYTDASERLILIAEAHIAATPPTSTDFRNLGLLGGEFIKMASENFEWVPTSFWIRDFDYEDAYAVEFAQHLNFFMHYFDNGTPKILLHEESTGAESPVSVPRLRLSEFPPEIKSRQMDPYLLSVWHASVETSDPVRRFLYHYQIIEYAAFYYMRDDTSNAVKRILGAPSTHGNLDSAVARILELVAEDRSDPEHRIRSVIRRFVEPSTIWSIIESNRHFFTKPFEFDGGFKLSELIKENWTLDDFIAAWTPKLPDMIRRLRNALVHARETRETNVIAPTRSNMRLLRPWIALVEAMATEVIVNREIN